MAVYSVITTKSAAREIDAIQNRLDRERIIRRVQQLAENPRPAGSKKLKGSDNTYRIRQGDYRIIYDVEDDRVLVLVLKVAHRKDVYRRRGRA